MTPELIMMLLIWTCIIAAGVFYLVGSLATMVVNRYTVRPGEVSNVSITSSAANEAEKRTDGGTDVGPSALQAERQRRSLDVIRAQTIDSLVLDGEDVETIRQVVKGSNDRIGQEVAEARERLGIVAPERKILVRDSTGQRVISL